MNDLKKYFEDYDDVETCPFCARLYPGEEEIEFEDWWAATECEHLCCCACTDWSGGYPLCPTCAREERERNGKAT